MTKLLVCITLILMTFSLLGMYAQLYMDYPHLHRYIHHVVERTDVNQELGIPAFFSTCLLLLAGCLLWIVGRVEALTDMERRWKGLAIIFFLLAMDESASFHEFLNFTTFNAYIPTSKYLRWTWVIPGMLFTLGVFVLYIPFLRALPRRTAGRMIVAGSLYVGGAIGIEMVGAALMVDEGLVSLHYGLATHLEELMEMSGVILFIHSLLDFLQTRAARAVIFYPSKQKESSERQTIPVKSLIHK